MISFINIKPLSHNNFEFYEIKEFIFRYNLIYLCRKVYKITKMERH